MRKVKVFARMCESDSGGFVTGIGTETKTYTEQEFRDKKHNELTAGIEMIEGCYWSWSLEWIKSDKKNEDLDTVFNVNRSGKYDEINSCECTLKTLGACLGYIDDNGSDIQTPLILTITDAKEKNWELGKNGLSGRVFLYDERENDFNDENSQNEDYSQVFSSLKERIENYLY